MAIGLLVGGANTLWAQVPALTPAPTPAPVDSARLRQQATDSIPTGVRANGQLVLDSTLTAGRDSATFSSDTTQLSARQEAAIRKIIPRQATIRSLILPGLGQAYNRQYYKIPFIYAGFGVMGYLFVKYRDLARQAENGYRLLLYGVNTTATVPAVPEPLQQTVVINTKPASVVIGDQIVRTTTGAKAGYDLYRRYRDLNILLSAALWGIQIVEANVAAHLKTFDLSDDISMRVQPSVLPVPGLGPGFVPGVRVAFTFK